MINYLYINVISSFIIFGYYTYRNDYSFKNKIKMKTTAELDKMYNKILPNVLFNVFCSSIPAIYLLNILVNDPRYHLLKNIPLVCKYIFLPFMVDILFYSSHKLLHNKYLFYFHKRHHELVNPIGIGSFYMSPFEFYCTVIIPVFGPLILLGANIYNIHLWTTFTIFNAICISHSNTKNLSEFHDYHHNNFKYNFGIDLFMDNLFNTKYYRHVNTN
jgi:sterol desaturase/sphingolipid hydroxylase (fatty acid hydroxylase superfamily)